MAFLNKGLRIELRDERPSSAYEVEQDGQMITKQPGDIFLYERGLVDYVEYLNKVRHAEVVNEAIIALESEDRARKNALEATMQWTTTSRTAERRAGTE